METFHPTPAFVNTVINHPSVRPTAERGTHTLDSAEQLSIAANYCLAFAGGVAFFVAQGGGVYCGHIYILEGSRGRDGLLFGRLALQSLSEQRGARKLVASVPVWLPAARTYCRRLGLQSSGLDLFEEHFNMEYK